MKDEISPRAKELIEMSDEKNEWLVQFFKQTRKKYPEMDDATFQAGFLLARIAELQIATEEMAYDLEKMRKRIGVFKGSRND